LTTPTRKYFIVFDRDRIHKKDLVFNVNFFYLKSFNIKKFSFTFINEPFFRGFVLFGRDFNDKMRPLEFKKIQKDNTVIPVNPRLFKKFLLAEKNKFIAFSEDAQESDYETITEMLENFQFDKNKVINLTFCSLCLDNNEFNMLNKSVQIKSVNKQTICSNCALSIVLREAKSIGLISEGRINPKIKNFFNHMLLKFKNVQKVLSAFKGDFNPVVNKEITLYDVEKTMPVSKKYKNKKITDLDIPLQFKNLLEELGIATLLPIQAISIKEGLLGEYSSQLIMAPTSGGKTLVGELAGISKVLNKKNLKMLYLVPIVALANVRTEEFSKKYKKFKIKIVKKVGESLLEKREEEDLEELVNANVIIATYEAIDYLLRSGKKSIIKDVATVIIDEIQTLIDPERGFILDGLIARLKTQYKNAQFLYLSATIGEPEILANNLSCKLIRYNNRPVAIERHLILCQDEFRKRNFISSLVKAAFFQKSRYGYKGQSIIFTNTRKKCEALTDYLNNKGLNIRSYHSGLTNEERKIIESQFQSQKIAGVVATAALAAGVDFPAKQVIFESLAMGIKWLTVAEFEQMLGRAGRLKKHDLGLTYLLVQPGKIYSPSMRNTTEENIAISLLSGKIKDFEQVPNKDKSITELLAFISIFDQGVNKDGIYEFYEFLINNDYDLEFFIKKLISNKLIRVKENFSIKVTHLGRSIAKSFLTIDQCLEIMETIKKKEKKLIEIVLNLKPIKNVYLSKKVVADLAKNVNMKYFSNNLFSASVLSLMNADNVKKKRGNYSRDFIEFITKWIADIFNCKCKDNPYCDCGRLNLEKLILSLRIDENFSINEIRNYLEEEYKILTFKGDLIDYFENLIYSLESIKNISKGISNLDPDYKTEISDIPNVIRKIKN